MRDGDVAKAQTPSTVAVDRRRLLRLAGAGISVGTAARLLPADAAAGWRNIQVRFFNYSGHRFSVEMWGEDGGAFRTHYTESHDASPVLLPQRHGNELSLRVDRRPGEPLKAVTDPCFRVSTS